MHGTGSIRLVQEAQGAFLAHYFDTHEANISVDQYSTTPERRVDLHDLILNYISLHADLLDSLRYFHALALANIRMYEDQFSAFR